jgi:hypothetical protein
MDPAAALTPLPRLVLWRGDGCHLCDDARTLVTTLLAGRAAAGLATPALVERRIADDPVAERELFELIPVLEFDGRRLPLAVRAGPVRDFLADVLDGRGVAEDPEPLTGGDERVGGRGRVDGWGS